MSIIYTSMGIWCLLAPTTVLTLTLTPNHTTKNPTTTLLMRCFGAQAATCGLLPGVSTMTRTSFLVFGLAMVPYIGFNGWFGVGPGRGVFTGWLWGDFLGNLGFAGGSFWCAWLLGGGGEEGRQLEKEKEEEEEEKEEEEEVDSGK